MPLLPIALFNGTERSSFCVYLERHGREDCMKDEIKKTDNTAKETIEKNKTASVGKVSMKMLPKELRPYEKCERMGAETLSDAELLAVILRTGSREENSLKLAERILSTCHPEGILGLLHLSLPQLMELKGVGRVKGLELLCIGELSRRIWKCLASECSQVFTDPAMISAFYMEDMRHMEQEELHLMMLNSKNALIRDSLIFKGTVSMSLASPRELFLEALRYHAVHIVLVHNHPSGDPAPSPEDKHMTLRIRDAGQLLGILLLDHIIIGDQSYFSFKERGIL